MTRNKPKRRIDKRATTSAALNEAVKALQALVGEQIELSESRYGETTLRLNWQDGHIATWRLADETTHKARIHTLD